MSLALCNILSLFYTFILEYTVLKIQDEQEVLELTSTC